MEARISGLGCNATAVSGKNHDDQRNTHRRVPVTYSDQVPAENGGWLAELWGRNGSQTPPPLRAGDVVTITLEGIGTLSTTVIRGMEPVPIPPARHRLTDRSRAVQQ